MDDVGISTTNIIPHKEESKKLDDTPKPTDFDIFVPWACKQFSLSCDVIISRSVLRAYVSSTSTKGAKGKSKRPSIALIAATPDSVDDLNSVLSVSDHDEEDNEEKITIETCYDNYERLIQIKFTNNKAIPRQVMQVIALTLPYQKYLSSIKIDSGLNMETLYEISKFLPISNINELCLDCTFLNEANYHTVLSANKLKHLSLSNCKINDAVVKFISSELLIPSPASKVLCLLNLSSNRISDEGAKYLADMLRTNRRLCYLNLAGNMITDEGGLEIINVLGKFRLQTEEITESRGRFVAYLRQKKAIMETHVKDLQESRKSDKFAQKKKLGLKFYEAEKAVIMHETQVLQERADCLAEQTLGVFHDPFSPNNTVTEYSSVYCLGNNILCYLNLAYNSLTYIALQRLREVLTEQKGSRRSPRGLIKVVIEGNPMPTACREYDDINKLLGIVPISTSNKMSDVFRRKPSMMARSPRN